MSEQRDLERLLKVNYANMNGLDDKTQILFKQLEWGINLNSNTMYLKTIGWDSLSWFILITNEQ